MGRLEQTVRRIGPLDEAAMAEAQARQDTLTKPRGSLGRLEELATQLAGIQRRPIPRIERKAVITMAADHGVAREGVSAYPVEVTGQMVANFLAGGAAINVLARQAGARVVVVNMGVAVDLPAHPQLLDRKIAHGTRSLTRGPAMSRDEAVRAIETGIEVVEAQVERGLDVVATGDMGIGNTTASSCLVVVLAGADVRAATGRGTGVDDAGLERKIAAIRSGIAVNRPNPADPLDTLSKVGGFEIAGLAGVILGAAANRVAVVIDGFISGAAALVAVGLAPASRPYLIAGHRSVEGGHTLTLQHLGLRPLLDLEMRLGEGTGAVLAMGIVEAAARILAEMATFADAGVSDRPAG